MDRIQRQRARLSELIEEAGSQKALAEKVQTAESYISQLLTARGGISRKFCARLEEATGKPDGWMDQWLPEESLPTVTAQPLTEAERKVLKMWRHMTPPVKRHVYSEMVRARAMPDLIAGSDITEPELSAFIIDTDTKYPSRDPEDDVDEVIRQRKKQQK